MLRLEIFPQGFKRREKRGDEVRSFLMLIASEFDAGFVGRVAFHRIRPVSVGGTEGDEGDIPLVDDSRVFDVGVVRARANNAATAQVFSGKFCF